MKRLLAPLLGLVGLVPLHAAPAGSDPYGRPETVFSIPKSSIPITSATRSAFNAARTAIEKEFDATDERQRKWREKKKIEAELNSLQWGNPWKTWRKKKALTEQLKKAEEDLLTASSDLQANQAATDIAAQNAIHEISKLYGFSQHLNQLPAPPPRVRDWKPTFARDIVIDKETGKPRIKNDSEIEAENKSNPLGSVGGNTTSERGEIKIFQQAFRQSPELLAAVIIHESRHWFDVAKTGGRYTNEVTPEVKFRAERDAYAFEARFLNAVGLQSEAKKVQNASKQFDTQLKYVLKRPNFSWTTIKLNRDRYITKGWIGIDRAFESSALLDDKANDFDLHTEALAEIRERAEDIRRSANQSDDSDLAIKRGKDEQLEEQRRTIIKVVNWATACGFRFADTRNMIFESKTKAPISAQLNFSGIEDFKDSMTVLAGCMYDGLPKSCVQDLSRMRRLWNEKSYKNRLRLKPGDSDERLVDCVDSIVDRKRAPRSLREVDEAGQEFWHDLRERRRKQRQREQSKKRGSEKRPKTERAPRDPDRTYMPDPEPDEEGPKPFWDPVLREWVIPVN